MTVSKFAIETFFPADEKKRWYFERKTKKTKLKLQEKGIEKDMKLKRTNNVLI